MTFCIGSWLRAEDADRPIFHLHGTCAEPKSVFLGQSSYDSLFASLHAHFVQRLLFATKSFVFNMEASLADEPVHLIINVDVLPDRAAEGEAVLREEGRLSRQDAGFMSWQLSAADRQGQSFAILEVWSGEIAFDRHVASDHARSARAKLQPLLASPFDERTFKLVE